MTNENQHRDGSKPKPQQIPLYRATHFGEVIINEAWLLQRSDGKMLMMLVNVAPVVDAEGQTVGAVNCWRDITERKGAEEAPRTLNRELEARTRQVRALASMVTMAKQKERRRVSQILHDDTQQVEALLVQRSAFGLFSMHDRLQLFGGEIEIVSAPNEGTHVIVRVPCSAGSMSAESRSEVSL